jgi:membrane fusion protein, multidrug efflux system
MKRVYVAIGFAVLLAVAGVAWQQGVFGKSTPTQGANPRGGAPTVAVIAAPVIQKSMPVQVETIGTVQTMASVVVRARVDSQIVKVMFKEGDAVKAGDVLFEFDKRSIEAQIRQAEAQLARSRAQLANSRREVERSQQLLARDYVSQQKADAIRTDSMALEATNRAEEAMLDNLRVTLSYYTVRAPISGRTGTIFLKEGNLAKGNDNAAATQLVIINQIDPIYVSYSVPQQMLGDLRDAQRAGPVLVEAAVQGSDVRVKGEVTFVDNTIDVASGTVNTKATFPNADEKLWPGQFVNVNMTMRIDSNVMVIPTPAVQIGQKGEYVYVIKPDRTAEYRAIKVGRIVGPETVIADGLKAGEQVVVDGQLRLTNGTRVEPRAMNATAQAVAGAN